MNEIKISFAEQKDREGLINLWHEVFEDSVEYIENFLKFNFEDNFVVVAKYKEKLVSAYYLIKSRFENSDAFYLYAAATLPEYRKFGIMGKLINFGIDFAKNSNVRYIILSPANESLYNYYKKFGFKTVFYINRYKLDPKNFEIRSTSQSDPDSEKILMLREKYLNDISHLTFDKNLIDYLISETKFSDNQIKSYDNSFVYFDENDDYIHIKEYFPFNFILPKKKDIVLDLPVNVDIGLNYKKLPQGMIYDVYDEFDNTAYLGITMG